MRAGVGNVFLNNSSASSSFRILIVSAIAKISSARILQRIAHSSSLVLQLFSKSFRKAESSTSAFDVSSKSSFCDTTATPSSPIFAIFVSMAFVNALISFVFAARRPSKSFNAASSAAVASARSFSIVSVICFKIPTIWPLAGAYSPLCVRKDVNMSRSTELMSMLTDNLLITEAAEVCRNAPPIPFSMAAVAFFIAAMLVL
mmetsp:Transcript_25806/g.41353  ORF Transcript_25806/g.41353 Transcript_25806/m.41353 type:complete len:202 (-) Transcript_25806:472-1077(-)